MTQAAGTQAAGTPESSTLLGLDIGTSAIKATVLDASGATLVVRSVPTPFVRSVPTPYVRSGSTPFAPSEPLDGTSRGLTEMRVADLFAAVHDVVSDLSPWLPTVGSVGIASLGESGGWVHRGAVVDLPILVWHDPRGRTTSDRLIETFGQAELLRRTGRRSRADLTVSKLGWWAEQDVRPPGVWTGVAGLLVWHLTGVLAQEPSLTATSGAYDPYRGHYDEEILAAAGVQLEWAPLVRAGTRIGAVTRDRAIATGLPVGIPVTIAGHDHPVGVLGAGGRPGMIVDSMGTGEPLVAAWTGGAPRTHPYLPGVDGDLTITCWPGTDALMILWEHLRPGLALGHLATRLGVPRAEIERAALDQPTDRPTAARRLAELEVDRVQLADLVGARRTPTGTDHPPAPARIWADVLDGYARESAIGEAGLRRLTGSTGPSLLIGGGVQSGRWVRAKQRVQTHGLVIARDKDAVARGAALMAGAAAGWWSTQHLPEPADAITDGTP